MERKEFLDIQEKLFHLLAEDLKEAGFDSKIETADEPNALPMLYVDFGEQGEISDNVFGRYSFTPQSENKQDALHLNIQMSVMEEIDPTTANNLILALNHINNLLAEGSFVVSFTEDIVKYKYSVTFKASEKIEDIFDYARFYTLVALKQINLWTDSITAIATGQMLLSDFLK